MQEEQAKIWYFWKFLPSSRVPFSSSNTISFLCAFLSWDTLPKVAVKHLLASKNCMFWKPLAIIELSDTLILSTKECIDHFEGKQIWKFSPLQFTLTRFLEKLIPRKDLWRNQRKDCSEKLFIGRSNTVIYTDRC